MKDIIKLLDKLDIDKSKYTIVEKEDEFQVIGTKTKNISIGRLKKESLTVFLEKEYNSDELNKKIHSVYDFLKS